MNSSMEVHRDSLLNVAERMRRGLLSSVEVTTELLDLTARHDDRLHSTSMLLTESALEQARQADAEMAAGKWRGPLHGVPIGIKDMLWTTGLPTTAGMDVLRDFRPEEDASVVERLREAGAVIIAKQHMTEGATLHHHPAFDRPVNPWSADHWTGVSSSGSAVATAAGFCFGAVGSDAGGSIRMPAAANNLTGIKPTWGRVSRYGAIPAAESFEHLGPIARSAGDAAAILQAIAGQDPRDLTSLPDPVPNYLAHKDVGVKGLRLGIDWADMSDGVPDEITVALDEARRVLEGAGMKVRDVEFPRERDGATSATLLAAELAVAQEELFPKHADRFSEWLRRDLEAASRHSGTSVAKAGLARARYRGRIRAMFGEVDLLLTPSLGSLVPTWEEVERAKLGHIPFDRNLFRYTMPFNIAGTPAMSIPAGFDHAGLPIGIQLCGPWLAEPDLIRAAVAFQKATDFHLLHPKL